MSEYIISSDDIRINHEGELVLDANLMEQIIRCRDCNNLMDNFGYVDGDISMPPTRRLETAQMSIPRSVLRGYHLLPMCRLAKISKHEYGPDDERCFCYGLLDGRTELPLYECIHCGAYYFNSMPEHIIEGKNNTLNHTKDRYER